MFNTKSITGLLSITFLGLVFALITSCGGGTNTSNTTTNTGSVALLLTDAPSDIFEQVNITVTRAELLSESGKVTLFEGDRTFNLLDLTDAKIFSIREGIASGSYSKIRLTLSKIELVDVDTNSYYYPKLPGNGKLDLNPRGSFDVVAGGTLTIQIDIDANKSIHIVKKGNKDEYNFRPVVFIDIVTDTFNERYIKLHGDITAIDSTDESFKLCNTDIPLRTSDDKENTSSKGCVRVTTENTTSIFGINGKPAAFINLVEGQPATVFGRLQRDTSSDDIDNNSDFAKINKDKVKHDDDDENEMDSDRDDDRELDDLVLKAALIELGDASAFLKLKGTATSAVDANDQFIMDVTAGQGYTTPLSLNVQLQTGTILINRKGVPLASSDIVNGKLVSVRGVLDLATDTLFASLVVVDTNSSTQLSGGTIGINPDNSCGFSLLSAEDNNGAVSDHSIASNDNTRAFLIVDGSSGPIDVSELASPLKADVYGTSNINGCFDAHTIIAYNPPVI